MKNIKGIFNSIKNSIANSPKVRMMMQYSFFVFISFLFWAFISLNNNINIDLQIPVKVNSLPDSTTIISDIPENVNINVRDKGMALLKFMVGKTPSLDLNFDDFALSDGRFYVPNVELRRRIRDLFESSTTLQSMSIDVIELKYTNLPAKKVPVRLDLDIKPNIQHIIYGPITQSMDSVLIYSDRNTLAKINEVYTNRIEENELTDTLVRMVSIKNINEAKIVPEKIMVTIPVEQLISKKLKIPVKVKNVPENENVITFPSEVEISFLVPFSMYRKNVAIEAVADYKDIRLTRGNKIAVAIEEYPELYNNLSLSQDSVEYIIEKYEGV